MENLHLNSKKSSKVKNIIIFILVVLIISLGGFVYSKVVEIKDENNKYQSLLEKTQADLKTIKESKSEKQKFNIKNKTMIQNVEYASYFKVIISKDGSAYLTLSDNYDPLKEESQEIKNGLEEIKKQYKEYKIDGYVNKDKTSTLKGIKLPVTDVIAGYESAGGLAVGDKYILFIKADGTISSLFTEDVLKGKINIVNNVNNLKNIVSVIPNYNEENNIHTVAIDSTGKQYILNFNQ